MAARIRIGTASWTDHEPFYPPEYMKKAMQAQRISYYARYFSLVEVDSTFYGLQPASNFQRWAERTPDDFIFDVKAYGEMTWHHRDDQGATLTPAADTFARFSEMVQPLREAKKLGAILFQFPPWFGFGEQNLEYLATVRELLPDDTIAIEYRNRTWLEGANLEQTRATLTDLRLAHCGVDEPQIGSGSVPPVVLVTDPHFAMTRFHGRNRKMWYAKNLKSSRDRFDYLYSRAEMAEWAERIERIAGQLQGSEVHVITNNNATTKVYPTLGQDTAQLPNVRWPSGPQPEAVVNALMLQSLLGQPIGKGKPLPPAIDAAFLQAVLQEESNSTD